MNEKPELLHGVTVTTYPKRSEYHGCVRFEFSRVHGELPYSHVFFPDEWAKILEIVKESEK